MHQMEEMIRTYGEVLPGDILKVGSFLNQQIDTRFLRACGEEIARLFAGCGVTKILTLEASGIALAASAGMAMDVPMVFAKKSMSTNVSGAVWTAKVHSYTHGNDATILLPRDYLSASERVLLVDDFLASGEALRGLRSLAEQAGAAVVGAAVAIEKLYQLGGETLRGEGLRVEALATVLSMEDGIITFRS